MASGPCAGGSLASKSCDVVLRNRELGRRRATPMQSPISRARQHLTALLHRLGKL